MFHSVSFSQEPLARGSSALPSVLLIMSLGRAIKKDHLWFKILLFVFIAIPMKRGGGGEVVQTLGFPLSLNFYNSYEKGGGLNPLDLPLDESLDDPLLHVAGKQLS